MRSATPEGAHVTKINKQQQRYLPMKLFGSKIGQKVSKSAQK